MLIEHGNIQFGNQSPIQWPVSVFPGPNRPTTAYEPIE